MKNEIDAKMLDWDLGVFLPSAQNQRPMIPEKYSRELVFSRKFILVYDYWEVIPSSVMEEYWAQNPEEIRAFIDEMLVWISPPKNRVRGFFSLIHELVGALKHGLEPHWIRYVESHQRDFIERQARLEKKGLIKRSLCQGNTRNGK